MRSLGLALILFLGCSGSTESTPANNDKDAGIDAAESGADTATEATDDAVDDAPFDPETCIWRSKWCQGGSVCVGAAHMVDCCGTLQIIGVNQTNMDQFVECEQQWRDSLPDCGCASQETTDDRGVPVEDIANVTAECTNFTSEGGICMSYQLP